MKTFLFILAVLLLMPFVVLAKSYELKLYVQDNGSVVFDRDFQPAIRLINADLNSTVNQSDFYAELVSLQSRAPILILPIIIPNAGKFIVNLPFIPDVGSIEIKKQPGDQVLFSTNVASLAVCNLNGKCEPQLKETKDNCYTDCLLEGYVAPEGTINSLTNTECYFNLICGGFYKNSYFIVGGVLVLLGVGGLLFKVKQRKNRLIKQSQISEVLPFSIPDGSKPFQIVPEEQVPHDPNFQTDKIQSSDNSSPRL